MRKLPLASTVVPLEPCRTADVTTTVVPDKGVPSRPSVLPSSAPVVSCARARGERITESSWQAKASMRTGVALIARTLMLDSRGWDSGQAAPDGRNIRQKATGNSTLRAARAYDPLSPHSLTRLKLLNIGWIWRIWSAGGATS